MEIDIKCLECGKGTRNFELGEVFYLADNASKSIIIKNAIICPKCSRDISNGECMVRENELLMMFVTANLCISCGDVPAHLKGAYPLQKRDYEMIKNRCKAKPKLVEKF